MRHPGGSSEAIRPSRSRQPTFPDFQNWKIVTMKSKLNYIIAIGVIVFNVLMVIAAQIAKRMLPVYGDADSSDTIVLTGDSHAAQWLPALERLARERGWRLVAVTKSACPAVRMTVCDGTAVELDDRNDAPNAVDRHQLPRGSNVLQAELYEIDLGSAFDHDGQSEALDRTELESGCDEATGIQDENDIRAPALDEQPVRIKEQYFVES